MSRTRTTGLVILIALAVLDIVGLAGFFVDDAPPVWVMIAGGALGVITLIGAALARVERRGALATVVVSRVLSAVLGAGVFTDATAPAWAKVVVTGAIVLTVAGVALIVAGRPAAVATRVAA